MIQFTRRANSYDPEFQKEHLKRSGEEPTPVIPNEIDNSSARFRAMITLFKRIGDECMIARLYDFCAVISGPQIAAARLGPQTHHSVV
jgi:hypothetical protein